jgi:hypothetical protein
MYESKSLEHRMESSLEQTRAHWESLASSYSEEEAFAAVQALTRSAGNDKARLEEAVVAYSVLGEHYEAREHECERHIAEIYTILGEKEMAAIFYALSEESGLLETFGFIPDWWNRA